jgi:hypothetical protein
LNIPAAAWAASLRRKATGFSGDHYTLLREILRFNREAPKMLTDPDAPGMTMGEFLAAGGYTPVLVDR